MRRPFYRVITTPEAEQERQRLSPHPRREVKAALRELRYQSPDLDIKPLEGVAGDIWRVRINNLRIVYQRERAERIIRVTRIRPRPVAYEGIERPPHPD